MPGFHPDAAQGEEAVQLERYLESLPEIYRAILKTFPKVEPARPKGYGLAYQTIHAELADQYSLGEIRAACLEMARHGVVAIRNAIYAHPTDLGEMLISGLIGPPPEEVVPPFPSPPSTFAARTTAFIRGE